MSSDIFLEPAAPPADPPARADERTTVMGFLHRQRATLEQLCSGLDAAAMARRAIEPSPMSLLGLVRHLADVERGWFRRAMARQDAPPHYRAEGLHDAAFEGAVPVPTVVADAWQVWRREVSFTDQYVTEAPSLDLAGEDPSHGVVSLRWVLLHLIEVYAQYNGYASLLREHINSTAGDLLVQTRRTDWGHTHDARPASHPDGGLFT
jgi:uncharacterized damage-inducible protein DinB